MKISRNQFANLIFFCLQCKVEFFVTNDCSQSLIEERKGFYFWFFHRFVKLSHEQGKNLINSISFITYRYMLATIFISHLTILGLSYKSIQSYQRKWSRDETWVKLTIYFHEYFEYESTNFFYHILCNICFQFSHMLKTRPTQNWEKNAFFAQ